MSQALRQPPEWPEADTQKLRDLWPEMKCAQLAVIFGVTRSAVSGKAKRIGLPPKKSGQRDPVAEPKAKAKTPASKSFLEKPFMPLPGQNPIPFLQTTFLTCKWPVGGHGADLLCCGRKTHRGPYCAKHAKIAFVPPQRRMRL